MAEEPFGPSEPVTFGKRSYSRVLEMIIPEGGPHVRIVSFHLPRFSDTPNVSTQIIASAGATPMTVYALKIVDDVNGGTQITVQTQTISPGPAAGRYWCNIVVTATPLQAVAK